MSTSETLDATVVDAPPAPKPARNVTRLNINISIETAEALRELAAAENTSITNVVRRAVNVYKFLDEQMSGSGKELQILDPRHDKATKIAWV